MADGYATPGDAFALQIAPQTCLARAALAAARPFLSPLLGLNRLRRLYEAAGSRPGPTFESRVLQALEVRFRVEAPNDGHIPPAGPLIVAANHPTGALDGLVLVETVRQVRTDVRVVTNHLLARIPELHVSCLFVDPFGGPAAAARSRAGLRAAHLWLREGGALVLFPAGEVAWRIGSDARGKPDRRVDSEWHSALGRLAQTTSAAVLPAFVDARNSPLFYLAGQVHPMLRTMRLGHELLNKRRAAVRVVLGDLVKPGAVSDNRPEAITESARGAMDALASAGTDRPSAHTASIDPPVEPSLLDRDLRALPGEALLLESGPYDVFCATADSIPHVLRELGRLREITFRAVGEGTGRATDIDRFDEHYEHLFVWHRVNREVVGAYRVGPTDRLLASHGLNGLYTRSLFRYDRRVLDRMGPALELGRSFVRREYQRSYSALFLLWRGIGELVVRSPRYRALFGCVSISSRYQETSQQMLREFLAREHLDEALADLVQAMNPPSPLRPPARDAAAPVDVDRLDEAITRIEGKHGIPVLLRQYLKLNARLLAFNVDPAFGDTLDALMMVDLAKLPLATLERYLGKTAASLISGGSRAAA